MAGNLAPWCKDEHWVFGTDDKGRFARVTGRERCPESLKSNWLWRFRNDYEEQLQPWFHGPDPTINGWMGPAWPIAQREAYWTYIRNPLRNGGLFVWGWADRNYTVRVKEGNPDPMTIQRDDTPGPDGKPEQGYQRAILTADDGSGETRTWTSFCGPKIIWYAGTQPTGFYGFKIKPA